MEYYEYTSKEGDRLDNISYDYYGDPLRYPDILKDNPQYHGKQVLGANQRVLVRVLSEEELNAIAPNLPPWKR